MTTFAKQYASLVWMSLFQPPLPSTGRRDRYVPAGPAHQEACVFSPILGLIQYITAVNRGRRRHYGIRRRRPPGFDLRLPLRRPASNRRLIAGTSFNAGAGFPKPATLQAQHCREFVLSPMPPLMGWRSDSAGAATGPALDSGVGEWSVRHPDQVGMQRARGALGPPPVRRP